MRTDACLQRPRRTWSLRLALVAAWALASGPLWAQVSGTLSLWSDRYYRGMATSDGRGQLQLVLNYDAPGGTYLSGLLVATPARRADGMVVLTAGQLWPLPGSAPGLALELGGNAVYRQAAPGASYAEAYLGIVAHRFSARAYAAPRSLGSANPSLYAELEGNLPLGTGNRWSVSQHLGWRHGTPSGVGAGRTRTDARVGLNLHLPEGDVSLSWLNHWPAGPGFGTRPIAADRRGSVLLGLVHAF